MHKSLPKSVLFVGGVVALLWIAAGYAGASPLALSVVLLIAALYVVGGIELRRYQQETDALVQVLGSTQEPVRDLAGWLAAVPFALRQVVRQRIEGDRVALPAPALTPYLVGLLVLLGMLGTLLGMMTTLQGTGAALASATDLEAIRTSLAAPVQGLAFAFGTSIAGVAASAMLGLLSALCRRDRARAAHLLDEALTVHLRSHSRAQRREEAFHLLQRQADAMPALLDQLRLTMVAIEQQAVAAHERQISAQAAFHERMESGQARLVGSLQQTLETGLAETARAAGAVLAPVARSTMDALAAHAAGMRSELDRTAGLHLQALSDTMETATQAVTDRWAQAVDQQRAANEAMVSELSSALAAANESHERRSSATVLELSNRFESASDLASKAWAEALAHQSEQGRLLAGRHEQALVSAAATFEAHATSLVTTIESAHVRLQDRLEAQTASHARGTLDEIARLVHDAAEAPKAAAAVIAELRQNISAGLERDNAMLEERGRLLSTVETLLAAVNHAAAEQRTAIDALIGTSAAALERVAARFGEQVDGQAAKLAGAADRLTAGVVEVASLGDVLGEVLGRFGEANSRLVERLQGVEQALAQSMSRSDEQLAYYVAQARDVVDLSVLTQKQIIGELQKLARQTAGEAMPA